MNEILSEKTNLSEAINDAVDKLSGMLRVSDPRASALFKGLKEAAQIKELEGIEASGELVDALTRFDPENVRTGAAFLTRPSWVIGRDLFSFDVAGSSQEAWHAPRPDEAELVGALEQALRAHGEDERAATGDAATEPARTALAKRLNSVELSQEDVLIAVPPFLPEMRLIYVALSDPEGVLSDREGLFYGVRDEDSGTWHVESFDYTSPNLHRLNQKLGVRIAGNELCYLRYFLQVVRGDEGAFRVIDRRFRDHIRQIIGDELRAEDVEFSVDDLFGAWHPMRCAGAWHSGGLKYDAWLLYAGAVFWARFVIHSNGNVSMIEDKPLAGPFPFLREQ